MSLSQARWGCLSSLLDLGPSWALDQGRSVLPKCGRCSLEKAKWSSCGPGPLLSSQTPGTLTSPEAGGISSGEFVQQRTDREGGNVQVFLMNWNRAVPR